MAYIKEGSRSINFKSGQDIVFYRNMLNSLMKDGYHVAHTHTDINKKDGTKVERKVLVSRSEGLHRIYTVKLTKDNQLAQDFYLLEVKHIQGDYEG